MSKKFDLVQNRKTLEVKALSGTTQEIYLYGSIGPSFWDEDAVSSGKFKDMLADLPETTNEIHLRINSPGGDVFDGIAIYHLLKQHDAKIVVYIDGLCASIASIIALAGDEIHMGEGGFYMIHLPWTCACGDRVSLDKTIETLANIEEQMLSIYMRRIKKSDKKAEVDRESVRKMLEEETWMDSKQAKELGIVDFEIEETEPIAASVMSKVSWFNKKPQVKTVEQECKASLSAIKKNIETFLAR